MVRKGDATLAALAGPELAGIVCTGALARVGALPTARATRACIATGTTSPRVAANTRAAAACVPSIATGSGFVPGACFPRTSKSTGSGLPGTPRDSPRSCIASLTGVSTGSLARGASRPSCAMPRLPGGASSTSSSGPAGIRTAGCPRAPPGSPETGASGSSPHADESNETIRIDERRKIRDRRTFVWGMGVPGATGVPTNLRVNLAHLGAR